MLKRANDNHVRELGQATCAGGLSSESYVMRWVEVFLCMNRVICRVSAQANAIPTGLIAESFVVDENFVALISASCLPAVAAAPMGCRAVRHAALEFSIE